MKRPNPERRLSPAALGSAAALLALTLASTSALADAPLVPPRAVVEQQQIQLQTREVKDEIGAIIAEYQNNGLGNTQDVVVLKSIQTALDNLSRQQMEEVLNLLAAARRDPDPASARGTLFSAIDEQNKIAMLLQAQLLQSKRQQDIAAIALRFNQLADRQNANLHLLSRYDRLAQGATVFGLTLVQRQYLQTQVTEQENIAEEVQQQLDRLAELTRSGDPAIAQLLIATQRDAAADGLLDLLRTAGDELAGSQSGLAAIAERRIRDALRRLAGLGSPPMDSVQRLHSAGQRLGRMIQEQQAIINGAGDLGKAVDASADRSARIEEQQADIVDDTDELAADLDLYDPQVSAMLNAAVLDMQRARLAILRLSPDETAAHAQDAVLQLQAALARITLIANRLEKLAAAQNSPDRVAALKESIMALRQEQEQLADQVANPQSADSLKGLAAQQAALSQEARDLLPFAAPSLPELPPLLTDAAGDMDHAAGDLGSVGDRAQARGHEDAAIVQLKKAEALLDSRAQQLADAQKELDDLEIARQRLAWTIVQQERFAVEIQQADAMGQSAAAPPTAPAAPATSPRPATSMPAVAALGVREAAIRTTTDEIRQLIAHRVPAADAALAQAQTDLASAVQALAAPDAHAALPPARAGLADLDAARKALDPQLSDLAKLLDQPDHQPNALDNLSQNIAQIVQDLQNPPDANRQALLALRDRERQVAADLGHQTATNPALKPAAAAAADAAANIERNQIPDALNQGQAVANALQPLANQPPPPALADIARQQAAINQALANRTPAAPAAQDQPATPLPSSTPASNTAAQPVQAPQAARSANDLTYAQVQDNGSMSPQLQQAMAQAEQALATASAQAAAGDQPAAQAARAQALQALSAAQNAIASAQSSMASAMSGPPTPGSPTPGPPTPGPPAPGIPASSPIPGPGQSGPPGADPPSPGGATAGLTATGNSGLIKLPPRDRAAIEQSRHDQFPQEYAPLIENYFKNLSEQKE